MRWTINTTDLNIVKLRLFHSNKFENENLLNFYKEQEDILNERNLVLEYLLEELELIYTLYFIFVFISFASFIISFMLINNKILFFSSLISSLIFYFISFKKKESLSYETTGFYLAQSIYNEKIEKKYNFI